MDEVLAISWLLGVAPVDMLVPFEEPDSLEGGGDMLFDAPEFLRVVDGIEMHPAEARAWLNRTSIRGFDDDERKRWLRFYYDEAPPPVRYGLERSGGGACRTERRCEPNRRSR